MSTPRRGTVNIRESNWRQGRSNIQSASDILKKRCYRLEKELTYPPGTKLPIQVYGEVSLYPCKYCNMKHIGRISSHVNVVGYISMKNALRYHINYLKRKNQNTQ